MANYKVTLQLTYRWLAGSSAGSAELNSFRNRLAQRLSRSLNVAASVSPLDVQCEGGLFGGALTSPLTPKICSVQFTVNTGAPVNKEALKNEIVGFTRENIKILGLIPGAFLVEIEAFVEEYIPLLPNLPPINLPHINIDVGGISELAIWFGFGFLSAWFMSKMFTLGIRKRSRR